MKSVRRVGGWRSLVGVLGVAALALGLSLKLEGAPPPVRTGSSGDKTRDGSRAPIPANVGSLSEIQAPSALPPESTFSVTAGKIPDTGLKVLSVSHVDWRDDEGTRRRQAGTLIGPLLDSGLGGVAGFGQLAPSCPPGFCTFSIDCDDNNACTSDRCDIIPGVGGCTGKCVADPIGDNNAGGCDDGSYCNGKETCQGDVCQPGSLRIMHCDGGLRKDQPCATNPECPPSASCVSTPFPGHPTGSASCDSHADCGQPGTCDFFTSKCTSGNIGVTCTTHDECAIRGTCSIGGAPCSSDAGCAPSNGTCTIIGICGGGQCTPGIAAICCPDNTDPTKKTVCSENSPRCSAESDIPGIVCRSSTDCKNGICERCQQSCVAGLFCKGGDRDGLSCTTVADCPDITSPIQATFCTTSCDDGRRCNGIEACELTCVGGTNDGKLCVNDAGCVGTGTPGKCLGQCEPGTPPCGAGARCSEGSCRATYASPAVPVKPCVVDTDCATVGDFCFPIPLSGANSNPKQVYCYLGRCCEPDIVNPAAELTCAKLNVKNCDATGDAIWYASDTGEQAANPPPSGEDPAYLCGDADARLLSAMVAWGCPKYTSGLTQPDGDHPPIHPVIIGPISASMTSVPLPNGSGIPLNQLGDDYKFVNESLCTGGPRPGTVCSADTDCGTGGRCGSYLALNVLRYVGYSVSGGTRASIDFYDAQGNFIEDVITDSMAGALGINVVIFTPPLVIAPSGWVVIRVAQDFAPNMQFRWASTSAGTCVGGSNPGRACAVNADCPGGGASCFLSGAGGNYPNALWINGYPGSASTVNNNFLKMCDAGPRKNEACRVAVPDDCPNGACVTAPGILAFELVGDKVADPVGACCESSSNTCVDGLVSWDCISQGNAFQGSGSFCKRCNGGTRGAQNCSIDTSCPPEAKCTTGRVGNPCPIGDNASCNEPGVCASGTLLCTNTHAPANTPCTVANQEADCGVAGTCVTQGTCSTGKKGSSCTLGNNASCNEVGVCDLETSVCVNPHAPGCLDTPPVCTKNCLGNTDCDIAGTCIDVSCESMTACGKGACCNPATGDCDVVANEACSGNWQGYGTDCDADNGYDAAKQHCCPIPKLPGKTCMGGPKNLQQCPTLTGTGSCNLSTGLCNGPAKPGEPCVTDADCDAGDDSFCRMCVGGRSNGDACSFTTDSTGGTCDIGGTNKCIGGGLRSGSDCTSDVDCKNGCVDAGSCNLTNHQCVGGLPPTPNVCATNADCPSNSGFCRGRCVNRWTGGDSCEDAFIHVITVPTIQEGPKTITISGSNLAATSTAEEPDSVWGVPTSVADDPGWWEAFSVDKCARVRLDFCCSDPVAQPQWSNLWSQGPSGCSDGTVLATSADPNTPGQGDFKRGDPYCVGEDNLWHTFGPLDPGTYWYPKYATLAGSHGSYQLHITVQSCVEAACCYLACTGGADNGQSCNPNLPCTGGVCSGGTGIGNACGSNVSCPGHCVNHPATVCTSLNNVCQALGDTCDATCSAACTSHCEQLTFNACEAKHGYSLSPPNISPAVSQCFETTCEGGDGGSCCIGPGICKDERDNGGNPVTERLCEDPTTFNGAGIFVGGVRCKGGKCAGGTDVGMSCNTGGDCQSGVCTGTAKQFLQPLPCPICTIEGSSNCQKYETPASQASPSDRSTGSGTKIADDFRLLTAGDLTSVCVTGAYVETDPATTTTADCGGSEDLASQRPDNFRVRIYEDLNGRPGALKGGSAAGGERFASRTKAVKPGATFNAGQAGAVAAKMWSYQLEFIGSAITFTTADAQKCWWLEVTNDTGVENSPTPGPCTWHWAQLAYDSTQANLYSAVGSDVNGYDEGAARPWDLVWCLNLNAVPGGCASEQRPCCDCQGACSSEFLNACNNASKTWHGDAPSCTDACVPPSNDTCGITCDAEGVCVSGKPESPVGLYSFTNYCATSDNNNVVGGGAATAFVNDVWYYFRVPPQPGGATTCSLRADSCTSSQLIFDSVLAIYYDPLNPTQCPCPKTQAEDNTWLVSGGDDNCTNYFESGAVVQVNEAHVGHCYTIRFGGFPPVSNGTGRAAVDISCGAPRCGDGRRNGTEICDGLDNEACRVVTPQNPVSTLCHPATDAVGVRCTCGVTNPCGNGSLDAGEECDPGSPGVACPISSPPAPCRPKGDAKQCTCPAVCGNDHIEVGEECDGNFPTVNHPCPGRCRSNEDPKVCLCPPQSCGNGRLETGNANEECEFGLCNPSTGLRKCSDPPYATCTSDNDPLCGTGVCLKVNYCSADVQCGAGTCDLTADRHDCSSGDCRTKNDPMGGCRCGCPSAAIVNNIKWNPTGRCTLSPFAACTVDADCAATGPCKLWPNDDPEATVRSLIFRVTEAAPGGASKVDAIKVTMVDLQHPNPRNAAANKPADYTTFDTRSNGVCTGGQYAGHHCDTNADCTGTTNGTCTPLFACTAAGEANGCARWVGKPSTFYESQGPPLAGPYRAARLQCTPYYGDWKSEPGGLVTVVGAEIVPSSEYSVQAYAATCLGAEAGCTDVSAPVTMHTRRSGDLDTPYNPGSLPITNQPNAADISQIVNKFKNVLGAPVHARAQLQPNLPELNNSISSLDIVAVVDAFKGIAYAFSGPCACPSAQVCGLTCTGCAGMCVKTCTGGTNDGEPCIAAAHCPGGACAATGTCRDKCGRCTPP